MGMGEWDEKHNFVIITETTAWNDNNGSRQGKIWDSDSVWTKRLWHHLGDDVYNFVATGDGLFAERPTVCVHPLLSASRWNAASLSLSLSWSLLIILVITFILLFLLPPVSSTLTIFSFHSYFLSSTFLSFSIFICLSCFGIPLNIYLPISLSTSLSLSPPLSSYFFPSLHLFLYHYPSHLSHLSKRALYSSFEILIDVKGLKVII